MLKNIFSYSRPTGQLTPAPADLAYGSLALAALEYQARRGEMIVLEAEETSLWRFALPRAGWWRTAPRARLPTRPLRPKSEQTGRSPQTPGLGAVPLLEPHHQWGLAQRERLNRYGEPGRFPLAGEAHAAPRMRLYPSRQGADTQLIQDYLGPRNIQPIVRYAVTDPARFEKPWR